MKFKEIKPGMVIHCPKEEDARALINYLRSLGYSRKHEGSESGIDMYCEIINSYTIDVSYGWNNPSYKDKFECSITEFSDLIEPDDSPINSDTDSPMSAKEVLEWLKENGTNSAVMQEVFGEMGIFPILEHNLPEDFVSKIAAYEAAKKAQKPVEVEEGYYCKIYTETETVAEFTDWRIAESLARERARKIAIKHAEEWNEPTFVDVHFVCRVKEGES